MKNTRGNFGDLILADRVTLGKPEEIGRTYTEEGVSKGGERSALGMIDEGTGWRDVFGVSVGFKECAGKKRSRTCTAIIAKS